LGGRKWAVIKNAVNQGRSKKKTRGMWGLSKGGEGGRRGFQASVEKKGKGNERDNVRSTTYFFLRSGITNRMRGTQDGGGAVLGNWKKRGTIPEARRNKPIREDKSLK